MTKLEELKAAADAANTAANDAWDAADAANTAANDAWDAYAAELNKTKEQTND
jgi:hypothetical protein